MPHLHRILVPLDNSDRAPLVLATALDLAEISGAKLVLFRAIGIPSDLPRTLLAMTDASLEEVLLQNARTDLQHLAKAAPPNRIESIQVMFGTPWDAICEKARELDVDLIVIGSHGYSGIDRVLGTTAGKVANHARCNVLIARQPVRQ